MAQRVSQLVIGIFFLALFSAKVWAQNPVRINWTAVTGAQSGIFMAAQEKPVQKIWSGCRADSYSFQL